MATQVTRTIGSGGNHATLDAFLAEVPANLVTADQQWTGIFLDGTALTKSAATVIGSRTTNASCYIEITGQTPGAASITMTGSGICIDVTQSYTRISKIKIASTNTTTSANPSLYVRSSATNCDVNQCIVDGYGQNAALRGALVISGSTNHIRNSLVIQRASDTAATIAGIFNGAKGTNLTLVSVNATMASGIASSTLAATLKNCYVGNATAAESGSFPATKTTCASSGTGTGWTSVPFSTATFVNLTTDFQLASGSALINAGTADATYAATDLNGTSRPQGGGTDIGAYERTPAGVTIDCTTGSAAAAGLDATISVTTDTVINCSVGNAAAAGLDATVGGPTTINCEVGSAAAAGATAAVGNFVMTDYITNNTGSRLAGVELDWYWFAGGFAGAAATLSGTATTDADGRLSPGIPYAAGELIARSADEGVYFEPFE